MSDIIDNKLLLRALKAGQKPCPSKTYETPEVQAKVEKLERARIQHQCALNNLLEELEQRTIEFAGNLENQADPVSDEPRKSTLRN